MVQYKRHEVNDFITNSSTIKFMMESSLMLQANFVYANKPVLTITNPSQTGESWSNELFTIAGTAKDKVAVTNLFYSLNGGAWSSAQTSNNWTNWTASVTLSQGTNTIATYAVNSSGNLSLANSVKIVYALSSVLSVEVSGEGVLFKPMPLMRPEMSL